MTYSAVAVVLVLMAVLLERISASVPETDHGRWRRALDHPLPYLIQKRAGIAV
jgi:hypothetical protein